MRRARVCTTAGMLAVCLGLAGGGVSAADLLLELALERERVYPGETLGVTVTLLTGEAQVRNIRYPVLGDGAYRVSEFAPPRQKTLEREGHQYSAHEFAATLTPLGSGRLRIGPAELVCDVLEPAAGAAAYFGGSEARTVRLESAAVDLRVLPLPVEGRPAGFSGAVGRFAMTRQVAPGAVRSGDPLTVTTRIEGEGRLDALSCPSIELPGVRAYPPRAQRSTRGLTCEQVLVPSAPGTLTLPAAAISFFDPRTGRYHKAKTEPIALAVAGHPVQAAAGTQAPPPQPATTAGVPRIALVLAAGILGFGLLLALALRGRAGGETGALPAPVADAPHTDWLAEARQALAAQDPVRFHTAVFRAMQAHLAARCGLTAASITGEVVNRMLRPRGIEEGLLEACAALFQVCDRARYSRAGQGQADMRDTYRLLERVLGQL